MNEFNDNNLIRSLNVSKVKDKVSFESLLNKISMFSVNQLNASIKLLEVWKALKVDNYPLKIKRQEATPNGTNTREDSTGRPID